MSGLPVVAPAVPRLDRREALIAAGGLCALGALAGCGGGGGGETPAVAAGIRLTALADVPVGSSTVVGDGKDKVVVFRPDGSTAVAYSAICTHAGCAVAPDGAQLACPCHGSRFEAATGQVVNGPADQPLPEVTVTVQDGQVVSA